MSVSDVNGPRNLATSSIAEGTSSWTTTHTQNKAKVGILIDFLLLYVAYRQGSANSDTRCMNKEKSLSFLLYNCYNNLSFMSFFLSFLSSFGYECFLFCNPTTMGFFFHTLYFFSSLMLACCSNLATICSLQGALFYLNYLPAPFHLICWRFIVRSIWWNLDMDILSHPHPFLARFDLLFIEGYSQFSFRVG